MDEWMGGVSLNSFPRHLYILPPPPPPPCLLFFRFVAPCPLSTFIKKDFRNQILRPGTPAEGDKSRTTHQTDRPTDQINPFCPTVDSAFMDPLNLLLLPLCFPIPSSYALLVKIDVLPMLKGESRKGKHKHNQYAGSFSFFYIGTLLGWER